MPVMILAMALLFSFELWGQATPYLKPIARSLLRQGFKRQIYITVGNAAGPETVSPLVLEFFYETRTPALYLEGDILLQKVKADVNRVFFGAYSWWGGSMIFR